MPGEVDPRSILFITLDSCRYDTFADVRPPNLSKVGPLHRAMAPATFTYGSHACMFVGFTPGVFDVHEPFLNPKFARIFKLQGGDETGPPWVRLQGRSIVAGLKALGYRTHGSGGVNWFNPRTAASRTLIGDFDTFWYAGRKSVREQVSFHLAAIAEAQSAPLLCFANIAETHVPYTFAGCDWSDDTNPCVPFATDNDATECRRRQSACLEHVDRELAPLLEAFAGANAIVCADHGDAWGENGLWEHGIHDPKVFEVPLLVRLTTPPVSEYASLTVVRDLDAGDVGQVRAFNRTVAQRIGALTDEFLGRARPMGESRVLWEVGDGGVAVRDLRARLNLDSGYMARVLQSLEAQRLVTITQSSRDGRVREVCLTSRGRAERRELDRRADAVASSFLEPLDSRQRERLVEAMTDVERLLRASMVEIRVEDASSADARWCVDQYFAELARRFEGGFDASRTLSADVREFTPPKGLILVARLGGRPVGCGALRFHLRSKPDVKRMWIAPEVRGIGLGKRMLARLELEARKAGARGVRLETNGSLKEAIAMYRANGYREVAPFNSEPYAHHWFEKSFVRTHRS